MTETHATWTPDEVRRTAGYVVGLLIALAVAGSSIYLAVSTGDPSVLPAVPVLDAGDTDADV